MSLAQAGLCVLLARVRYPAGHERPEPGRHLRNGAAPPLTHPTHQPAA